MPSIFSKDELAYVRSYVSLCGLTHTLNHEFGGDRTCLQVKDCVDRLLLPPTVRDTHFCPRHSLLSATLLACPLSRCAPCTRHALHPSVTLRSLADTHATAPLPRCASCTRHARCRPPQYHAGLLAHDTHTVYTLTSCLRSVTLTPCIGFNFVPWCHCTGTGFFLHWVCSAAALRAFAFRDFASFALGLQRTAAPTARLREDAFIFQ
jgi:hypothetical protein